MNGQQAIEVTVTQEGHVTVEAMGYVGKSCEEATKFLERALGTAVQTQRSPAFYAREPMQQREVERG